MRMSTTEISYPNLIANACYVHSVSSEPEDGVALKRKLLRKVFEVASEPDTRDSNRRKMYALWKENYEEDPTED